MSDRQQPRDLTPSFTATDEVGPRPWKVVGADRAGTCTFCGGGPTEAVVGCPDRDAPILFAACRECLTDLIMTRIAALKHQRMLALAKDMNAAADEIVKLRNHARWNERDPAELRAEELAIREVRTASRHAASRRHSPGITACCDPTPRAAWLNRGAGSASRTQHVQQVRRVLRQSRDEIPRLGEPIPPTVAPQSRNQTPPPLVPVRLFLFCFYRGYRDRRR